MVDCFELIPDSLQSLLKNSAPTRWSWSEKISWGLLMTGTTLPRYRSARPSAVRVLLHGTATTYPVKRQTTTKT